MSSTDDDEPRSRGRADRSTVPGNTYINGTTVICRRNNTEVLATIKQYDHQRRLYRVSYTDSLENFWIQSSDVLRECESPTISRPDESQFQLEPQLATSPQPPSWAECRGAEDRAEFEKLFKRKRWRAIPMGDPLSEGSTRCRALVIAITYGYQKPPGNIPGTYIDAYRIIRMLVERFGYAHDDICVLADITIREVGSPRNDKSRWPCGDNIRKALEWLSMSEAGQNERRFLFFAGHGQRQISKGNSGISSEGIMPRDVDFQRFSPCESCDCENASWDDGTSLGQYKEWLLPDPPTVIWDYELNNILAKNLQPGTRLTVIFDCCHSGGTIRSTIYNGADVTEREDARSQRKRTSVCITDTILPEKLIPSLTDGNEVLPGNLLGLPVQTDLAVSETPALPESLRPRSGNVATACQMFTEGFLKPSNQPFHEECEVLLWAACKDYQLAHESTNNGGRFTAALVDYISKRAMVGGTYQLLNRHIHSEFERYNVASDMHGKQQHAKFFTSNNVAEKSGYFQGTLYM